jgi:hypothetical protein
MVSAGCVPVKSRLYHYIHDRNQNEESPQERPVEQFGGVSWTPKMRQVDKVEPCP